MLKVSNVELVVVRGVWLEDAEDPGEVETLFMLPRLDDEKTVDANVDMLVVV